MYYMLQKYFLELQVIWIIQGQSSLTVLRIGKWILENKLPQTKRVAIAVQTILQNCPERKITINAASLVAQTVKHLPTVWETGVQSLCWEYPLKKGMAAHSRILVWGIPQTEEPMIAEFHGVAKSWTQLSKQHFHFHRAKQKTTVPSSALQPLWIRKPTSTYFITTYSTMDIVMGFLPQITFHTHRLNH